MADYENNFRSTATRILIISESPSSLMPSLLRDFGTDKKYAIGNLRPTQLDFDNPKLTSAILIFDMGPSVARKFLKKIEGNISHKSLYNYYHTILISPEKNKAIQGRFYNMNIDHIVPKRDVADILPLILNRARKDIEYNQYLVNHTLRLHSRLLGKERESSTDELTGLKNMRGFKERLKREIQKRFRSKGKFAVIMFDIDNFKAVNDSTDHVFGSLVLGKIGRIIKSQLRETDTPARFGGDEFVILLHNTDAKGARIVAEKIRKAIYEADFSDKRHSIKATASFGVAAFCVDSQLTKVVENSHVDECLRLVDGQLYNSKRGGKNRVSGLALPTRID